MSDVPQQGVREQSPAHSDAVMDAPHCELDACLFQPLPPSQDVLVDAVHQRAVKVEQKAGLLLTALSPGAALRARCRVRPSFCDGMLGCRAFSLLMFLLEGRCFRPAAVDVYARSQLRRERSILWPAPNCGYLVATLLRELNCQMARRSHRFPSPARSPLRARHDEDKPHKAQPGLSQWFAVAGGDADTAA
jgi:hypothetical protein